MKIESTAGLAMASTETQVMLLNLLRELPMTMESDLVTDEGKEDSIFSNKTKTARLFDQGKIRLWREWTRLSPHVLYSELLYHESRFAADKCRTCYLTCGSHVRCPRHWPSRRPGASS